MHRWSRRGPDCPGRCRYETWSATRYNPRDSFGDLEELASIVEFQLQPVVVVTRGAFQNIYPGDQHFGPVGGHHR